MIWTNETPTVPGQYWLGKGWLNPPEVVQIGMLDGCQGLHCQIQGSEQQTPLSSMDGCEWAGPIPLPADAIDDADTISLTASFRGSVYGKAIKSSQLWSDVEGDQPGYSIVDGLRELVDKAHSEAQ